ncbi:DUF835 domain-containing protein [Thermococcus barophilus]|uniref:DUF835 domain-containing protein n=1 Tax=Thermococcus barophilus (strain DSM 11836 / MP) TaxID=391623 RepID=F0LMQ3_THEBM|nr:DUF835 domain-containing protein [Thermococcus barophilus]ADT84032.1 hypothetical protein TERMP_01056 [Thermococcus barophilus MP]
MFKMLKDMMSANVKFEGEELPFQVVHYSKMRNLLKKFSHKKKILITRTPPTVNDNATFYIWISKIDHPNAVSPTDLYVIEQKVWEIIKKESPIIVLDAFEYLMMEQGLEATLRFTGKLRDIALLNNSGFIVSISEGLDDKTVALLKRIVEG